MMDLHIDINDLWDIDTQKDNNTVDRNMILDVAKEAVSLTFATRLQKYFFTGMTSPN